MRVHSSVTNMRDHAVGINTPLFKLPETAWFKDRTVTERRFRSAFHTCVHTDFISIGFYFIFPHWLKLCLNAASHIHNADTLVEDKEQNDQKWCSKCWGHLKFGLWCQATKTLIHICFRIQFRDRIERINPVKFKKPLGKTAAECPWHETGMTVSAQWLKAYNLDNAEVTLFSTSYNRESIKPQPVRGPVNRATGLILLWALFKLWHVKYLLWKRSIRFSKHEL